MQFRRAASGTPFCFEDTILVGEEDYYNLVLDSEFGLHITTCAYETDSGHLLVQQGYGGQGEGVTYIDFGGGTFVSVTPDNFVYDCDVIMPALGYLQLNTGNFESGGPTANLHYKICGTKI